MAGAEKKNQKKERWYNGGDFQLIFQMSGGEGVVQNSRKTNPQPENAAWLPELVQDRNMSVDTFEISWTFSTLADVGNLVELHFWVRKKGFSSTDCGRLSSWRLISGPSEQSSKGIGKRPSARPIRDTSLSRRRAHCGGGYLFTPPAIHSSLSQRRKSRNFRRGNCW